MGNMEEATGSGLMPSGDIKRNPEITESTSCPNSIGMNLLLVTMMVVVKEVNILAIGSLFLAYFSPFLVFLLLFYLFLN